MTAQDMSDDRYGSIVVERKVGKGERRIVAVSGKKIPSASITRNGGSEVRHDVPVGTRRSRYLQLALGGQNYDLSPSAGRFSRRSYRVEVAGHGAHWLFAPVTRDSSRLVRAGRYAGSSELGIFTADAVAITARWSELADANIADQAFNISPHDCALGYLLAASFGTGSRSMLMGIFNSVVDPLVPG
jgi:hypothetical protein